MQALAVIPARYASTRFPGKPLANRTGKTLIQHVVERVRLAKRVSQIIVATDDQRIFDAVMGFGGQALMTGDHPNGTSRIAEAVVKISQQANEPTSHQGGGTSSSMARSLDGSVASSPEIIVNIQGDEPEIEPELIDKLIVGLIADADAPMATLASEFAADEDPANPNIVKIIVDQHGRAMYFSRSLIPYIRDAPAPSHPPSAIHHLPFLKHPGMYAYRRDFLLKYVTLPATPLEQAEQLEQLRALEHGYRIAVIRADARHHGIDTPEQYEAFVQRHRKAGGT